MNEQIFKWRVILKPEIIDISISSKHTYLNAKLCCSLMIDNLAFFVFHSQQFDLYEGEQLLSIRHGFPQLTVRGIKLSIELINQYGEKVDGYCEVLQDESENLWRPLVEAKGNVNRLTEGGSITIELAGVAIKVYTHYNDILQQLKTYATLRDNVCEVFVDEKEILKEKEEADRTYKYPPIKSNIEMYALRKKVSESILDFNCFQIHGAAFAVDNCGYIFTADSGIGKTTHMRLWMENLKNAYVVNGDQPIVKVDKDVMVCGSPWCGKEGWNSNVMVPLKAIVIMERGNENTIVEISMTEALIELLRQVYKPYDSVKMSKTLQLLSLLEGKIKFYRFKFDNFAEDAFSVSYNKIHMGQ